MHSGVTLIIQKQVHCRAHCGHVSSVTNPTGTPVPCEGPITFSFCSSVVYCPYTQSSMLHQSNRRDNRRWPLYTSKRICILSSSCTPIERNRTTLLHSTPSFILWNINRYPTVTSGRIILPVMYPIITATNSSQ